MPRPKKETRNGLLGEAEKKKRIKKPVDANMQNVRIKKTRRKTVPTPEVSIRYDAESDNLTHSSVFLHLNTATGIAEIAYEIPCNTLTIRMTRVHFKTLQYAQQYFAIGITMNIISQVQINGNLSVAPIPVLSNWTSTDTITYPDVPLTIGKNLPRRFEFRVVDLTTGNTIPDGVIDFIQIWMSYSVLTS